MSWGSLEFNLSKGVTLIDGWNEDDQTSEGSGKSAILNAMSWCLYGKLPKEVNIDEVIKRGQASCAVLLEFDDGTTIIRSRKPNDLMMKRDDKVIKGKDARETQQLIQDYIGRTFESFCQTTYFAQNDTKKFLLSNQEEKGKTLSDIQDILVFDKARKEVQVLLKTETDKLTSLSNQLKLDQSSLMNLQTQQSMVKSFLDQKEKQHKLHLEDLRVKRANLMLSVHKDSQNIKHMSDQLQSINLQFLASQAEELENKKIALSVEARELSQKHSKMDELRKSVSSKENEGNRYAARYKSLSTKKESLDAYILNPTKKCPSCGSELQNVDVSHAQKELNDISTEMNQILQMLEDISKYLDSTKIETNDELIQKYGQLTSALEEVNTSIRANKGQTDQYTFMANSLQNLQSQIDRSNQMIQEYDVSIENQKSPDLTQEFMQLGALETQEQVVNQKIAQLKLIEDQTKLYASQLEALKEGFKEIKSYVFNTALNELSYRANQFLSVLFQMPAQISFVNEDLKIETKILLGEEETSIGLLSGGQFRRFSLAIDLALSDMVSSRQNSKLGVLILDEYFKDLSETSMEKCLDLLKLRKSPVLLIEHNSIFKNIVDNTFFVRLEKGTSNESRE